MKVLVIGGSGYVGGLTLPLLGDEFDLRVYDRKPPKHPWEYVCGAVTDQEAIAAAAAGCEALLYMAMGKGPATSPSDEINELNAAYDVNVKGVHITLEAARKAGVERAVYTSSLSVYTETADISHGATDREDTPTEPTSVYGLTKWMGEEACRFVHRKRGFPVLALRLFNPVSQTVWQSRHKEGQADCRTSAPDLARAFAAALRLKHNSFEVIHITGDTTGSAYHHEKARALLGWEPREGK